MKPFAEYQLPTADCRLRIGIFGGALNPPHSGHISIIQESIAALKLDKIILALSVNPPHKSKNLAPFEERAELLEAYFGGDSKVIVDRTEKETGLTDNFTYITLPLLKKKYGVNNEYFYIMGGDSLLNFHLWKHPELIAKEAALAVVPRKGYGGIDLAIENVRCKFEAEIVKLPFECEDISSTEVRVFIDKIKQYASEELFAHLARTTAYAMKFAKKLNISYEKVYLAAMLHDIAKEMPPLKKSYPTNSKKVIHQYDGAEIAKTEFLIEDSDVLEAIKFHTTGKPGMTPLQKLIYAADKLESGRFYAGVDEIRAEIEEDFEEGFIMLLKRNVEHLKSLGKENDVLTIEAYKYYTKGSG